MQFTTCQWRIVESVCAESESLSGRSETVACDLWGGRPDERELAPSFMECRSERNFNTNWGDKTTMNIGKFAIASLFMLAGMGAPALADTLQDIVEKGEVAAGVKADFAPWGMRGADGSVEGLEIDLANDFARQLTEKTGVDIKAKFVVVSSSNRMEFLEQGQIDVLIATMSDTPERREIVGMIQPSYYSSGIAVLAHKSSGIDGWDSLSGKKLCGTQGAWFNKDFGTKNGAEMIVFKGNPEAEAALLAGRCEGWLYDDSAFKARLQSDPDKWVDFKISTPVVADAPWSAAVRKSDQNSPLAAALSDAIIGWHKSGKIAELEQKWGIGPSAWILEMQAKCQAGDPVCDSVRDDSAAGN